VKSPGLFFKETGRCANQALPLNIETEHFEL